MASCTDLFLCLDQGGHASRAVVFDGSGEKVAELSRDTVTTVNGMRVELEANSLVTAMQQLISDIIQQLGSDANRLVAAGLATQRSNIACWHRQTGEPLAPIFSWQDRRAVRLVEGLDPAWVHAKTGLYPNAHYGASKLAWCLQNLDEVKRAAQSGDLYLGPMASFLGHALTMKPGSVQAYADPANATRTLLYNLHKLNWDDDLCGYFSIPQSALPSCVPSRYEYGDLTWLGGKLPLRIITGDLSAAAFVHGRPQTDIAYITLGTGAFVQRILQQNLVTDLRLLNGIIWHDGEQGLYSLEGTVNGAASALQWFARQQGLDMDYVQQHLSSWCEQIESPSLFTNGVSGLGSPFWQAEFVPRFIGEGDVAAQAVAVVESIVFLLYENLCLMHRYLSPPGKILLSGGLSALDGLCQRLADLSGIDVERSAESEGTAKGLAYLLSDMPEQWRAKIDRRFSARPNEGLRQRYQSWRNTMLAETGYTEEA